MAASPFGCNQKNSFGSKLNKLKETGPPKPVTIIAEANQVITAIIPFNTKRAAEIRQHMHSHITENGQRVFIYRSVNGWTNISLESTESAPKLTCDPITTLKMCWREFTNCPAVSTVTIKWKGSDDALGYDDIDGMQAQFEDLPAESEAAQDGSASKTDAEILYDHIDALSKNVDKLYDLVSDNETKLTHIIEVVEKISTCLSDVGTPQSTPGPSAGKSAGGKRQRN